MNAPDVRVVHGEPDDVELAALVAGLVATAAAVGEDAPGAATTPSVWADRARAVGLRPTPLRDSWRWSGR